MSAWGAEAVQPSMAPAEILEVQTQDGWLNELRRYGGSGPPVVLVHGMGTNHYNFDYAEPVSLAHALSEEGYDVWIVSLRGDRGTIPPSRRARRTISFDDYLQHDLPAALDLVLERSGSETVAWVGHSLGGMLLYAWLSEHAGTPLAQRVSAGVAVASPAGFPETIDRKSSSRFVSMLPRRGNLPVEAVVRSTAWLGRSHPSYDRLANPDNLDPALVRGMARHAISNIPIPLAHQARSWSMTGEVSALDGSPWIPERSEVDVPLLVLGAPLDKVVGEGNVRAACEVFPDCTYVRLGREQGFSADYGHVDPLVGVRAKDEVYPLILDFLRQHSPSGAEMAPAE